MPDTRNKSKDGTADDNVVETPEGIPAGLPPEHWMQYLQMKMTAETEKLRLENETEKLRLENEEKARQRELEKEREKTERLRIEAEIRKAELANASTNQSNSESQSKFDMRVPRLKDNDDIDVYLRAFELMAEANNWEKAEWPKYLIPSLSGKAREVFANLSVEQSQNYDVLKQAILAKYEINAESYRLKFRSARKKVNSTITEWVNDLSYYLDGWIKFAQVDDFQALKDLILVEQATTKLPDDLAIYLKDKQVTTGVDLAREADAYVMNRGGSVYWQNHRNYNGAQNGGQRAGQKNGMAKSPASCYKCGQQGHIQKFCPQLNHVNAPSQRVSNDTQRNVSSMNMTSGTQRSMGQKQVRFNVTCFNCGVTGHMRNECPQKHASQSNSSGPRPKSVFKCQDIGLHTADVARERMNRCLIDGQVEGKSVKILRDSACEHSVINAKLVPHSCYLPGRTVELKGIGGTVILPIAQVNINSQIVSGIVNVAVVDDLDQDILLGHDLDPTCSETISKQVYITTRAQAKRDKEEFTQGESELFAKAKCLDEFDVVSSVHGTNHAADEGKLSEAENTTPVLDQVDANTNHLCIPRKTLMEKQQSDRSLEGVRQRKVDLQEIDKHRVCFYERNGVLMRKWSRKKNDGSSTVERHSVEQIVVPTEYRQSIMYVAHDKAGHLGIEKTKDRILQHFYWPNVFQDVMLYCRSCDKCQRMDKSKQARKYPLLPMPVIDVPFKRIGIDIVGPLPRSRKRNAYLMTICDYATRYPEAIPLSNMRSDTVVNALMQVFARIGLPQEIVHDQGTNFMSKVMRGICDNLGITQIATTARHQQTNGLTERFHGTLKNMLRSLTDVQMKCWDDYIPYFLFSYREVPCQTTGYSPFELLYGRQVRGPLSVLKQAWLDTEEEPQDVLSHIVQMRERMDDFLANANSNTEKCQVKYKKHYDRNAKVREFMPNDQVLVFLPEGGSKLESKWQGPYVIKRRLNEVNYEVVMPDKSKKLRVVHVNLLKRWYNRADSDRIASCMYITGVVHEIGQSPNVDIDEQNVTMNDVNCDDVSPNCVQTQTWRQVEIESNLSESQTCDVEQVLSAFSELFSDVPGRTHLVEHNIALLDHEPVRQSAYRMPHAMRDPVEQELNHMLDAGIIERTTSEYASPIVVVPKSDGSVRVCSDMRMLNKKSKFDPYKMPRIDEILDKVGSAKYITTLDLTKGFYQIPLNEQSRDCTSFVTAFGQFRYTVLPFGLQNSSSTFQRLMDQVLRDCQEFACAYIDDICIYSQSWEDHVFHLQSVFQRLLDAGLTVKPGKCKVAKQRVEYLGHIIGNCTITPMQDKVQAVQEFPRPITKKNVRAFLGLTGYYRKFIPNYAQIAKPLNDLTKKQASNTVVWNQGCETAFLKLKSCLISAPILVTPDFNRQFVVQTDASNFGIGAVLSQVDDEGIDHPIVYLSRKLSAAEERYSVPEKEMLAIVWAVQKLEYYLIGYKFKIATDHQALKWLATAKCTNNRLMRWFLALQKFSFDVEYRKGVVNGNADGLSRA